MDKRNVEITTKIFEVLNNVKGFDVAIGDPNTGKLIVRYGDTSFYLSVDPIFNESEYGEKENKLPFNELVRKKSWVLNN